MGAEVWLVVAGLMMAAWMYSRWRHSYWSSRGVPTPPFLPFLGHMHKQISLFQFRWDYIDEVYYKNGGSKYCGLYELFRPVLMIGDPDLLKNIFVKDFDHFVDRRRILAEDGSILNEMLSNKTGDEWKTLRDILTPTFTSGKMRSMFPIICSKADDLVYFSLKEAAIKPFIDMNANFGRFTMDTIASCAFGIECNSFEKEESEFAKRAGDFFEFSLLKVLIFTLFNMYPRVCSALGIKMELSPVKFFRSVVEETIAARKSGQRRGDYLDLLLDARAGHEDISAPYSLTSTHSQDATARDSPTVEHHTVIKETPSSTDKVSLTQCKKMLTDKSIVAQCVLFLIAGYDTTASALAFSSFLLAKYPIHQLHLREEVQQMIEEHGDITYQGILEAKFLDACIMETLRLYPPGTFGERLCTKTYKLPGTEVTLHPGDLVTIPFWSLHHDPRYWQHPDEFQPDRFLPENKAKITGFTHMPFGIGPRNCIAMRFALMEAKVALAKLVIASELRLARGHEELKLTSSPFPLKADGGVNLVVIPLPAGKQS
ncbi:cytochrome P450 9e2-like isoform X1 [Cherax quadricarinatus]